MLAVSGREDLPLAIGLMVHPRRRMHPIPHSPSVASPAASGRLLHGLRVLWSGVNWSTAQPRPTYALLDRQGVVGEVIQVGHAKHLEEHRWRIGGQPSSAKPC
jgi:hypothetical protein